MKTENLIITEQDYVRLFPIAHSHLLSEELSRAIVVSADRIPTNIVKMNSRVIYLDESNGLSLEVELVFPDEVDLKCGKISVLSPVGSALLGHKEGQSIEWSYINDQYRRLKVVSVVHTT